MNKTQVKKNRHIKTLLERANKYDLKVRFVNESIYGWAHGAYDDKKKVVDVCLRRPDGAFFGIADIVFILAHEIRHAQHRNLRMFPEYYDDNAKVAYYLIDISSDNHFKKAWAAEKDCDLYAKKFIDRHMPKNKSILRNRVYPAWRVHPTFLPKKILNKRRKIDTYYSFKKIINKLNLVYFKRKDGTVAEFETKKKPAKRGKITICLGTY